MLFGTAVTALAGLAYIGVGWLDDAAFAVSAFLTIRLLHGLSTGFRPTGTSAFLTDLVPMHRRGEALGIWGGRQRRHGLGPSLGSWLAVDFGYDAMFAASSLLGVVSYFMTRKLPETLPNARPVSMEDLNVFQGGTVEPAAWPAALFLLPVAVAFGTFLTVTPDLVEGLGFVYKGSFNTIVVIASIAMRLVAGKASDKYGRPQLLLIGAVLWRWACGCFPRRRLCLCWWRQGLFTACPWASTCRRFLRGQWIWRQKGKRPLPWAPC